MLASGKRNLGDCTGKPPLWTDVHKGTARHEVAQTVGLGSGRTYERHKEIVEQAEAEAPELIEQAAAGEVDIPELSGISTVFCGILVLGLRSWFGV